MFNNESALSIFQLRYKIEIYFADRQESRRGPAQVRGPAVEKHWSSAQMKLHEGDVCVFGEMLVRDLIAYYSGTTFL